ncbi:P-loop containing nucleoside triphosphate hydrolase protein [Punctularia strigosozonata HHB-11173 SS5]|uniref:P-loop containing nucleoside triphosphate hydrolase protein n=1 Tax=Punctularia strigosozonata (strain HHB-11173) TaxID=741275 RepID=UPI00044171D1|nr:P-loop containing nucleoside triphosphate hydrolase protein [Punctularia strigosozonata HHB-11173 SS5]EIN07942.1 P-loop containing nucleoside triphosphate hydrolase protein [Punctularia strigosozonata HHB-11173 SS5]
MAARLPAFASATDATDASGYMVLRAVSLALAVSSLAHLFYLVIRDRRTPLSEHAIAEGHGWRARIAYSGGIYGVFLRAVRAVGTAIYAVSAIAYLISNSGSGSGLHFDVVLEAVVTGYAFVLGALSLSTSRRWQRRCDAHLGILLLAHFGVSAYIYLRAVTIVGQDPPGRGTTPWYIWYSAQLLSLFILCIFVPLAIPGPQSSDPVKRASIGSFLTWGYYTPAIWYAARHGHLPPSKLPPLDPHDETSYLIAHAFPKIDPVALKRPRHVIWSLLDIFKWDYALMILVALCESVTGFVSLVGVRHVLSYLEDPDAARVRPWVWVLWIGLGPIVYSVVSNWYLYLGSQILVRSEAIVTQLAFKHALRIRMKPKDEPLAGDAEVAEESGAQEDDPSPAPTPNEEQGEEADPASTEERSTSRASTATVAPSDSGATDDTKAKQGQKAEEDEKQRTRQMIGRINNLVTSDVSEMQQARDFPELLSHFMSTVISVYLLWDLLGWSAFVGIVIVVVTLPVPAWAAGKMMSSQRGKMAASDRRVQAVSQVMNVLRMIKLFAWERKYMERLAKLREEEISWIRYNGYLWLSTYALDTLVMKQELTGARIFTSITVFTILQGQISQITYMLPDILNAKVALDRINEFFNDTELIRPNAGLEDAPTQIPPSYNDDSRVGFADATFTWDKIETGRTKNAKKRHFRLSIAGEVTFERGAINLIVGPTGSGKTSTLLALLGEMYYYPQNEASWYNLPRGGHIAYAAQESWVLNETIRENIVFGSPFDEARYQKVQDLDMLASGDRTEVGEKGITLRQVVDGQKARVTLARAVYSKADIVLLDDVLAALDVHTAKHVVDRCLKGDLLRGRTVLLVTHNLALTRSLAKKVIRVDRQGHVMAESSLNEAIEHDASLGQELAKEEELVQKAEAAIPFEEPGDAAAKKDDSGNAGKLIVAEDIAHGTVGMDAIMLYLRNVGGPWFWFWRLTFVATSAAFKLYEPYFLGIWSNQYMDHDAADVPATKYLSGYAALCLLELVTGALAWTLWLAGSMRASARIHRLLVESVFGATFRWLDTVPVSRVIARCTKDIRSVDGGVRNMYNVQQILIVSVLFRIVAIVYVVGWGALAAGLTVLIIGFGMGRFYNTAQRAVKREQSVAKAPVLSLFGAGLAGLPSIRAYGAQEHFGRQLTTRINHYTMLTRNLQNINRWVVVRINTLGAMFSAIVAASVLYGGLISVGDAGFALLQVLGFGTEVFVLVRFSNTAEVESNSLERILDFLKIEHEPEPTKEGVPPAYWPASGSLRAKNLSARYALDSADVLHHVSFDVKSGERIGVVGRTGAGKSTISLALLRALNSSGQVLYDGLDIHKINLNSLRANITFIPQHPDLLSGNIRENLDPFGEHDDATLNEALQSAGLFRLQKSGDAAAITLDSEVEQGGMNFSHGQRQIIALARAYVRRSKLMIMDEATAAIDYETDAAIQESIRSNLGDDITIITIAHRLQTIMDSDKIMVLDSGRLAQFGTPSELLAQRKGLFFELVENSSDKAALYGMVKPSNLSL